MQIQGRRKEVDGGVVLVKAEPSVRIEHGLFVEVNEEFKPLDKETSESDGAKLGASTSG